MGKLSIANSTYALLKFASLLETESYNQVAYLDIETNSNHVFKLNLQIYIYIYNIYIYTYRTSCLSILSHYQRLHRRLNYQHR